MRQLFAPPAAAAPTAASHQLRPGVGEPRLREGVHLPHAGVDRARGGEADGAAVVGDGGGPGAARVGHGLGVAHVVGERSGVDVGGREDPGVGVEDPPAVRGHDQRDHGQPVGGRRGAHRHRRGGPSEVVDHERLWRLAVGYVDPPARARQLPEAEPLVDPGGGAPAGADEQRLAAVLEGQVDRRAADPRRQAAVAEVGMRRDRPEVRDRRNGPGGDDHAGRSHSDASALEEDRQVVVLGLAAEEDVDGDVGRLVPDVGPEVDQLMGQRGVERYVVLFDHAHSVVCQIRLGASSSDEVDAGDSGFFASSVSFCAIYIWPVCHSGRK